MVELGSLTILVRIDFFPYSKICKIFTTSIFPILILSLAYCYVIYIIFQNGYDFLNNFKLYLSLAELLYLFSDSSFLIVIWINLLAINLFCGGWIVNDYQKFGISKILMFFPLLITYLIGPLGITIYWLIRIFYAKRISIYD